MTPEIENALVAWWQAAMIVRRAPWSELQGGDRAQCHAAAVRTENEAKVQLHDLIEATHPPAAPK